MSFPLGVGSFIPSTVHVLSFLQCSSHFQHGSPNFYICPSSFFLLYFIYFKNSKNQRLGNLMLPPQTCGRGEGSLCHNKKSWCLGSIPGSGAPILFHINSTTALHLTQDSTYTRHIKKMFVLRESQKKGQKKKNFIPISESPLPGVKNC